MYDEIKIGPPKGKDQVRQITFKKTEEDWKSSGVIADAWSIQGVLVLLNIGRKPFAIFKDVAELETWLKTKSAKVIVEP